MSYVWYKMLQIGCDVDGVWYVIVFGGYGMVLIMVVGEMFVVVLVEGWLVLDGFVVFGFMCMFGLVGFVVVQFMYMVYQVCDVFVFCCC